jgi:mevalonate kinase
VAKKKPALLCLKKQTVNFKNIKSKSKIKNKMPEENKVVPENKATDKTVKEVAPMQKLLENMPEWVTPLLSALGSMGGSYMLFIKPMQERLNVVESQLSDLRSEVKELKHQNKNLERALEGIEENQGSNLNGYLTVNKPNRQGLKKRM